jgi:hypothetical protein
MTALRSVSLSKPPKVHTFGTFESWLCHGALPEQVRPLHGRITWEGDENETCK